MWAARPRRNGVDPSEQRHAQSSRAERCSVRPPGAKRRLPCIPCYLFSILLFLIVLVMLWLALSSPNGSR